MAPPHFAPRKAVITAAGLGTRFLPVTKAVPKELLPIVDVPAIQYVVEEAARAGLGDILLVTRRGKDAIIDYFDTAPELEAVLAEKGEKNRIDQVRDAELHFIRQGNPAGLGHAVSRAAAFVGDETFAVLLGDDLIDERDELLTTMTRVHAEFGGSVLALLPVPPDAVSQYGCVAGAHVDGDLIRVTDLVEKPAPEDAPSNLAIIGRYLLAPTVFEALENTQPGRGGEIQLTDAIRALVDAGEPVHGVIFRGRRYDTGDRAEYLRTVVRIACERDDVGPDFRQFLREFVAELG